MSSLTRKVFVSFLMLLVVNSCVLIENVTSKTQPPSTQVQSYTFTPRSINTITSSPPPTNTPTYRIPTFDNRYVTSTPRPGLDKLSAISTPVFSTTQNSSVNKFADVKRSNNLGQVTIQDSLSQTSIVVETRDKVTGNPIPSILVEYLSDGVSYTLIGIDSKGIYQPLVITNSIKSSNIIPTSDLFLASHNLNMGYISNQGEWDYIFEFMDFVSNASTLDDLASLLSDLPTLEQHAIFYNEWCMTGTQMANTYGFATGAAGLFLSVFNIFPIKGEVLRNIYGAVATAFLGISQAGLSNSAKDFLKSQPGAYLIRFYTLPVPFTILLFEIRGVCTQEEDLKPEQLMFDTREETLISSRKLLLGQAYEIKITGTFSLWDAQFWKKQGVASGLPESKPMFIQSGISACVASNDAQYLFALPNEAYCTICPTSGLPGLFPKIMFSLDGKVAFTEIKPVSPIFSKDHTYIYHIIGKGMPLMLYLPDTTYSDNCGEFKVEISPIDN